MDQSPGRNDNDHQRDDRQSGKQETSTAEKAVMVISVTFTVLLFAYAGWQMASAPPTGPPEVSVVETMTWKMIASLSQFGFEIRRTLG